MDESSGHGSNTRDCNNKTAILLDAFNMALSPFEWARCDTDTVADMIFGTVIAEIDETFFACRGNKDKELHFAVRDSGRLAGNAVRIDPETFIEF